MWFTDVDVTPARDKRLTHFDVRLFTWLARVMDKDNCVMIQQGEIADALNVKRSYISKSLKHLRETGYISPGEYGRIVVNPYYARKGP